MQNVVSKIRLFFFYLQEFFVLALTFRAKTEGIKIFGRPNFLGGPNTKYQQLLPICANRWESYNTIFCLSAVTVPIPLLRVLKLLGVKVIVNQNGVYYPGWFSGEYKAKNFYLRNLNILADYTFFQSAFALDSYKHWVGDAGNFSVLHNPVDVKKYVPKEIASREIRLLFFTDVSSFNEKLWVHFLNFLDSLDAKSYPQVTIVVLGRILEPKVFERLALQRRFGQSPFKIEAHYNCNQDEVVKILQTCDLAFHLVYNDVCPNKVLEAMACGVWMIVSSAGGSAELVGSAGKILPVPFTYSEPQYPDFKVMEDALNDYIDNHEGRKQKSIDRAQEFAIDKWYQPIQEKVRELSQL